MYQFAMFQVPTAVVSILAFLVSIGLLILVHEWGHYIMAKRGGVPVQEFSMGMGPVVARLGQRDETTFNLRAFPIGGFVRMSGMEPGDEAEGGFNSKPMWTRAKVLSAGVVVNLVFGFLLFVILGVSVGMPVEDRTSLSIGGVERGSAAAQAGLKPGDGILQIDGRRVTTPRALTDAIRSRPSQTVTLTIQRHGRTLAVKAVPASKAEDGKVIGRLGFEVGPGLTWQRQGLASSVTIGAERSWLLANGILRTLFSRMTWRQRQLGGPIAIAQQAGSQAEQGGRYLIMFVAILSINLGVLNLLPIPALDGGHMLLLLVEAVRRRKLPAKTALVVQGLGFALLLSFILYVTVSDVLRTINKG